jgi:hypothetical protein
METKEGMGFFPIPIEREPIFLASSLALLEQRIPEDWDSEKPTFLG